MRNSRFVDQRTFGVLLMALLLSVALAGCGGSGSGGDDDDSSVVREQVRGSGGGVEAEPEANDDGVAFAADQDSAEAGAPNIDYVANQAPFDRYIIRTVDISLTVESVADGSIWVRDLAARKNGFVFSSNTYVRDESEFAQITIRVPSNELDSTVRELREHQLVVQVDSEESTSQDVSQEYVDNESRLSALEETQRRFLALLSEAETVEEILRIESELTNIRSQIETIKGRQNYLDQMTSMSTVSVTLHVEDQYVEEVAEEGFLAGIIGDSWDNARGFIEGLTAVTVTLGMIALAVLPFALIFYIIGRFIYRRVAGTARVETVPAASSPSIESVD
jgi:hypothetical protein